MTLRLTRLAPVCPDGRANEEGLDDSSGDFPRRRWFRFRILGRKEEKGDTSYISLLVFCKKGLPRYFEFSLHVLLLRIQILGTNAAQKARQVLVPCQINN